MNLEEKKKFIINVTYFTLWFALIFLLFRIAAAYLLPLFIGIIIAFMVQKPASFISQKIKFKREICAAILSVFFYITFFVIISLLIWLIFVQIERILKSISTNEDIRNSFKSLTNFITKFMSRLNSNNETISNFAQEAEMGVINKVGGLLSDFITLVLKKIPSIIVSVIITIVLTCYFAKDFDRLKMFFKGFVNSKIYNKASMIKSILFDCVFKIALGYFWLFLITFIQLLTGLFVLRVKNFFTFAVLISFIDLLPVLGTGAVLLPWAIFEFVKRDFKMGIGIIVLYVIIMVVRNFIEPKIIGKQIGINPLFTLIFIFLGLRIGGIIGMIFLPIVLTVAFSYFKKQMSTNELNV